MRYPQERVCHKSRPFFVLLVPGRSHYVLVEELLVQGPVLYLPNIRQRDVLPGVTHRSGLICQFASSIKGLA